MLSWSQPVPYGFERKKIYSGILFVHVIENFLAIMLVVHIVDVTVNSATNSFWTFLIFSRLGIFVWIYYTASHSIVQHFMIQLESHVLSLQYVQQ